MEIKRDEIYDDLRELKEKKCQLEAGLIVTIATPITTTITITINITNSITMTITSVSILMFDIHIINIVIIIVAGVNKGRTGQPLDRIVRRCSPTRILRGPSLAVPVSLCKLDTRNKN